MSHREREIKKLRTYLENQLKKYPQFFICDIDFYGKKFELRRKFEYFGLGNTGNIVIKFLEPYRIDKNIPGGRYQFWLDDEPMRFYQILRKLLKGRQQ